MTPFGLGDISIPRPEVMVRVTGADGSVTLCRARSIETNGMGGAMVDVTLPPRLLTYKVSVTISCPVCSQDVRMDAVSNSAGSARILDDALTDHLKSAKHTDEQWRKLYFDSMGAGE